MVRRTTAPKLVCPLPSEEKAVRSRRPGPRRELPAAGIVAGKASPQSPLCTYRRVTNIIWQRLSPTFGMRTINAIARNVIAREVGEYPLLRHLEVSDAGLGWGELERRAPTVTAEDMHLAIDDFINAFFEALANMIGQMVVSRLFTDAELALRKEAKP